MRFISPKIHGIIDYLIVIILLASPWYFGFTGFAATFTYALAAAFLLLSLFSNYAPGVFKVIPLALHAFIESFIGIALIVLAYTLFGHNVDGKLFYIIFGTVILLTWLMTDYRTRPRKEPDPAL